MVIKDSINSPNPLAKMLESWISHYQGMGKVHTIVFDFDDTLAPTMTIQVEAWIEAIESALKRKLISEDQLVQAIKEARADRKRYNQCITNIFVEYQMAEQILDAILPGIDNKTREAIDTDRFERRQKLMTGEKGSLFPGVKDALRTLQDKYQLAIVTATSSELVTRFLDKHEVLDCFSIILGKDDPRHTWVNVHSKSILLIEVSGLTGIPLDRLVFIGDNTSDYEAAYQVGVTFIEATQAARSIGKDSLIKDEAKCGRKLHEQFEGFTDKAKVLDDIIRELNQEWI
jgi:phosphoglycolate phosphatase-like HAD superfamily hydrolase